MNRIQQALEWIASLSPEQLKAEMKRAERTVEDKMPEEAWLLPPRKWAEVLLLTLWLEDHPM
ncbi:MAG: hypothetical protein IKX22_07285 [Prevotella sp.]|nr:hypothetical protein [Prevotella sp.]